MFAKPRSQTNRFGSSRSRNWPTTCLRRASWLSTNSPVEQLDQYLAAARVQGVPPGVRRDRGQAAFQDWQGIIGGRLVAAGLPDAAAGELATTTLALLEGAELLARVQASTVPLERAAAALRTLARAARVDSDSAGGPA
jgi:hypothetical protein